MKTTLVVVVVVVVVVASTKDPGLPLAGRDSVCARKL